MGRYIDRSKFEQLITERDLRTISTKTIGECLDKSLADVVEVVRCKDCKFWNKDENRGICDEWSDFEDGISRYTGADDYCSCGERKEK